MLWNALHERGQIGWRLLPPSRQRRQIVPEFRPQAQVSCGARMFDRSEMSTPGWTRHGRAEPMPKRSVELQFGSFGLGRGSRCEPDWNSALRSGRRFPWLSIRRAEFHDAHFQRTEWGSWNSPLRAVRASACFASSPPSRPSRDSSFWDEDGARRDAWPTLRATPNRGLLAKQRCDASGNI